MLSSLDGKVEFGKILWLVFGRAEFDKMLPSINRLNFDKMLSSVDSKDGI